MGYVNPFSWASGQGTKPFSNYVKAWTIPGASTILAGYYTILSYLSLLEENRRKPFSRYPQSLANIESYLGQTSLVNFEHEELRALGETLIERSKVQTMANIFEYVANLTYTDETKNMPWQERNAFATMQRGSGNIDDFNILATTLLRWIGVPTRVVEINPGLFQSGNQHGVTQVYYRRGWRTVDFSNPLCFGTFEDNPEYKEFNMGILSKAQQEILMRKATILEEQNLYSSDAFEHTGWTDWGSIWDPLNIIWNEFTTIDETNTIMMGLDPRIWAGMVSGWRREHYMSGDITEPGHFDW